VGPISHNSKLLEQLDLVTLNELDDDELFVTDSELELKLLLVIETDNDDRLWLESELELDSLLTD